MTLPMKTRAFPLVGMAFVSAACGNGGDAQSEAKSPPARADAAVDNATFETARAIEVGSSGILSFVEGREDQDYYSFQGKKGEWIEIRSSSLDPITIADARLTLYDRAHTQLAYNASVQSLRGENVLARIVSRLPEDGMYFIEVGDPDAPPVSAELSQSYHLRVTDLATDTDGFTVEDTAATDSTPLNFHRWNIDSIVIDDSFVAGSYSDESDVDAFSFTVPQGVPETLSAEVEASGNQADGSTTTVGKVWVTSRSDAAVIARIDNTTGQNMLTPPLDAGDYVLWVSHPAGPVGTNDFYVLRTLLGPENPVEAADATNGAVTSAEPLTTIDSGGQNEAFILAHVLANDVDYFRFDGRTGQTASAYCESAGGGSGVVGLHVSIRDDADASLAEATEVAATSSGPGGRAALENVAVPASASLYIRIEKGSQLADVIGDWARCAVFAH